MSRRLRAAMEVEISSDLMLFSRISVRSAVFFSVMKTVMPITTTENAITKSTEIDWILLFFNITPPQALLSLRSIILFYKHFW
jgi:hypothetical protein